MDSSGQRQIKKLWLIYVVGIILMAAVVFLFSYRNLAESKKQINEMVTIYPEVEDAIHNTFSYYDAIRNRSIFFLGGSCIVIYSIIVGFMILSKKREIKKIIKLEQTNQGILEEQLSRFQRGDYTIEPNLFMKSETEEEWESWFQIEDRLKELGSNIILLKERLNQEENATKALITDISHQLKTPLASLKMSNELSQEQSLSLEERAEFLENEKHEIAKLESLLDELVKLSRLESHMILLKKETTGIKKLITDAINQIFLKAYAKKIELQADIKEEILIHADVKWTVEAFVNVLDNAIKYSPEKTVIQVRVKRFLSVVLVEIEDEGIGIPASELHKIFQRFYRGESAMHYSKDGAGVGLYLTRKILEEQGGTIAAKRKQAGTIFKITLPL